MKKNVLVSVGCLMIVASVICMAGKKIAEAAEESLETQKVSFDLSMHVANVKDQEPAMYAVVQAFMERNPNVNINLYGEETTEHYKKMKMYAQADTLPDVFFNLVTPSRDMAREGKLYCLDDFIAENKLADVMEENMLNTLQVDGHIYGLPYQSLVTGFWYNQALFDRYGVKVPQRYEELLEAVKVFSKNGIVTIANGARDPYSVWGHMSLLVRYGFFDRIDNVLAGRDSFNNEDFVRFYEKIDELRKLGVYAPNVAILSYYDAKEMFMIGRASMFDSGMWECAYLERSEYKDHISFMWGVEFPDGIGEQKVAQKVAHSPLCISAKVAKDPAKLEAILSFFKFYYSQEAAKIMLESLVIPPINYTGELSQDFLAQHPVFAKALDALSLAEREGYYYPPMQPDNVSDEAFANALYDSIYGVINGVYTPKEAVDMVQKEIER